MMTCLKNDNGLEEHCPSCHDDHDGGYAQFDEMWDFSMYPEPTPPDKQYCCCAQAKLGKL